MNVQRTSSAQVAVPRHHRRRSRRAALATATTADAAPAQATIVPLQLWVSMRATQQGGISTRLLGRAIARPFAATRARAREGVRAATGATTSYVGTAHFRGSSGGIGVATEPPQARTVGGRGGGRNPPAHRTNHEQRSPGRFRHRPAAGHVPLPSRYVPRRATWGKMGGVDEFVTDSRAPDGQMLVGGRGVDGCGWSNGGPIVPAVERRNGQCG